MPDLSALDVALFVGIGVAYGVVIAFALALCKAAAREPWRNQ